MVNQYPIIEDRCTWSQAALGWHLATRASGERLIGRAVLSHGLFDLTLRCCRLFVNAHASASGGKMIVHLTE